MIKINNLVAKNMRKVNLSHVFKDKKKEELKSRKIKHKKLQSKGESLWIFLRLI